MKIILLGAGSVGSSLAESLAHEKIDIVMVDSNAKRLRDLQDKLDIGTVCGHASHPNILRKAGAEDADMLVAITDNDEINMLACQLAHMLYRTTKKICRVRADAYLSQQGLFKDADKKDDENRNKLPIDVLINPEKLVTKYIERLLEYPGALQVLDFANDRIGLVGVKAFYGGPIVGQALNQIPKHMPNIDTRVAAIYRRNRSITPEGETIVEADDEVFFIAATEHIPAMMAELRGMDKPYKRIMIAGASNIARRLAQAIEKRYQVKVIDSSLEACEALADTLHRTIVLHGDPSDRDMLLSENIDSCDVFCALTNDDETNIMSSLLAKRLGAGKVLTLISNPAYVDLVQGGEIDIALSLQQITVGSLLKHVRRGDMSNVYSLRRGAAEAIEVIAHGDARTSKVVGRAIGDLRLPDGASIGAIVRRGKVIIAHKPVVIESEDHVILFLTRKNTVREVEKLFAVGLGFF